MNSEIYSYLTPLILEAGANDIYFENIIMKKGRAAVKITVLCTVENEEKLKKIIFQETTTLGIRRIEIEREELERKFFKVNTVYGEISIKAGYLEGKEIKRAPEYEECAAAARNHGVPIREVYEESLRKYLEENKK